MPTKLQLIVHKTDKELREIKLYKRYLRDIRNMYMTFEDWKEKYGK